jgi:hypothetical protein
MPTRNGKGKKSMSAVTYKDNLTLMARYTPAPEL